MDSEVLRTDRCGITPRPEFGPLTVSRTAFSINPLGSVIVGIRRDRPVRETKTMPVLIPEPTRVEAAGNKPKLIDEFVGWVNSGHNELSIARMRSPGGWVEPGQTPEFDEYTLVLSGLLRVEHRDGVIDVAAGQAVVVHRGEWVRYSTPDPSGAEYIAICLPAFTLPAAHRDSE
jgi:mannose-6-phosphate isomerase-like protein (cupin superfamily)